MVVINLYYWAVWTMSETEFLYSYANVHSNTLHVPTNKCQGVMILISS